jgi:hypothetical protein
VKEMQYNTIDKPTVWSTKKINNNRVFLVQASWGRKSQEAKNRVKNKCEKGKEKTIKIK